MVEMTDKKALMRSKKVFVKTGRVDERGTPYIKLIDYKDRQLFNDDDVLDWVKV